MRGELPIVFATPGLDRVRDIPANAQPHRVCQIRGLDDLADDLCVLHFSQADVGRGAVPTALDAPTHEHFWPASATAAWGRTRDLDPSIGRGRIGVRECVVRTFPASHVTEIELIEGG